MKEIAVFYLSDSTALTAKVLGKSLLSLFDKIKFVEFWRPFINSKQKLLEVIKEIYFIKNHYNQEPIIFVSMIDEDLSNILYKEFPHIIDILRPFVPKLEKSLRKESIKQVGLAHRQNDQGEYDKRIMAIDFALACDDGLKTDWYDKADLILLGLSRSGKTPTSIFLALQFGLNVANYPFTSEDLPKFYLSEVLLKNRLKLFGLIINDLRLCSIRKERRPSGQYADIKHIKKELKALEDLYIKEKIPFLDTTNKSVEEIASSIAARVQK